MNAVLKHTRIAAGLASRLIPVVLLLLVLTACDTGEDAEVAAPTAEPEMVAVEVEPTEEPAEPTVEPTWTAVPVIVEDEPEATEPPPPTSTHMPTSTPVVATETPEPTATESTTPTTEPTATATDVPPSPTSPPPTAPPVTAVPATAAPVQPTAVPQPETPPTAPPEPQLGANLLPNPSFEEGHYNQNGVPELQLPVQWRLEWDEGPTGVGDAAWDVYVRPEARVLSTAFLPPEEHNLYIYNGQNTVKIFKGQGAVNFRLLTEVTLQPGTYIIEAKMFADIVERWENRQKVWAQDPHAAEFRFLVGNGGTNWTPQNFGQINVHNYTFTVDQPQTMTVGIGLRGRYAIGNNGWFIDDLSLRRIE